MLRFKIVVFSLAAASLVLMAAPQAYAADAPATELKSVSSTYCLDLWNDQVSQGAELVTYPCTNGDKAEHFAINKDQYGHVHIYFSPSYCVANVGGRALLEKCTSSSTNLQETPIVSGVVTFADSGQMMVDQTPTKSNKYPLTLFTNKDKSSTTSQEWHFFNVN
jgi:hypothetical protein